MKKPAKTTEVKQKVRKASAVKVRKIHEVRPFLSKPETGPLNDVWINDKFIEGLSVSEKIAEGEQLPFVKRRDPDVWTKSPEEKKKLKELKDRTRITGWAASLDKPSARRMLIVYIPNHNKEAKFKTVHSFTDVKESEIRTILEAFFIKRFHPKDERPDSHFVKSYFYNGKLKHL